MALESEGSSAEVSESVSTESSSAPSESKSGYSVTDPGYDSDISSEPVVDELAAIKAENTKETKPDSTESDASDTDGETEESEETPAAESAESNDISDELLDKATELGYTLEELKGFRSEKALAKDIARVESIQKRLQERQGKKPADEPVVEQPDPEPNWEEMIEEGHDPANVAIQKQLWQRAAKAEALVQQVYQAEQTREFNAQCQRFDETLNKLEGFEKILGSGRKDEIAKTSPDQAANRQKVFTTMQILKRGYEEAGVTVPAEAELIEAAAMASFPKHAQTIVRNKLKADIKKAGSQSLSRPHSTGAKPLSGAPLAAAKEDAFWKKMSVR